MTEHQEANKKRLGELVTDSYKLAGYSRESVAPEIGITSRTLFSIENGIATPRAHTQRKLEEVLGWGKGAIADVLGFGPDADLSKIDLEWMKGPHRSSWTIVKSSGIVATVRQLRAATDQVTLLVEEQDRQIRDLERQLDERARLADALEEDKVGLEARIKRLEQDVASFKSGYDLATGSSPEAGKGAAGPPGTR